MARHGYKKVRHDHCIRPIEHALLVPGARRAENALIACLRGLTPRYQWRNPVMFVVYIGSILTTILWVQALGGKGEAPAGFILAVTLGLWVDRCCLRTSPKR